jgi:osmotically inducible protein OsmC
MASHASVRWTGNFKQGEGQISTDSGVLQNITYSVAKRFEGEPGTNPEELLAAAHAACFSMALAAEFSKDHNVKAIETSATVTMEKEGNGWRIATSHLDCEADIDGISEDEFLSKAEEIKMACPVSKALNLEITLEARLKDLSSEIMNGQRSDQKSDSQKLYKNSWVESSD